MQPASEKCSYLEERCKEGSLKKNLLYFNQNEDMGLNPATPCSGLCHCLAKARGKMVLKGRL